MRILWYHVDRYSIIWYLNKTDFYSKGQNISYILFVLLLLLFKIKIENKREIQCNIIVQR